MWIVVYFSDAGVPATGLSATIRVRDLYDNSLVVTDAAMTEVGDGEYKYNFSTRVSSHAYSYRCDGSATLDDADRYKSDVIDIDTLTPFHDLGRYILDEDPIVDGDFGVGDTVTITLYDKDTLSAVTLTSNTCSEVASSGKFVWNYENVSSPATAFTQYLYKMSGTSSESWGEFAVGGYPDTLVDSLVGSGGSTHTVTDTYTLDKNRFNDLEGILKELTSLVIKTKNAVNRDAGAKTNINELREALRKKKVI